MTIYTALQIAEQGNILDAIKVFLKCKDSWNKNFIEQWCWSLKIHEESDFYRLLQKYDASNYEGLAIETIIKLFDYHEKDFFSFKFFLKHLYGVPDYIKCDNVIKFYLDSNCYNSDYYWPSDIQNCLRHITQNDIERKLIDLYLNQSLNYQYIEDFVQDTRYLYSQYFIRRLNP